MTKKFKRKFIGVSLIVIGIITILVGEYIFVSALEYTKNSKMYIADINFVNKYSRSIFDLRRSVQVSYKIGEQQQSESFEYYTFIMPRENQIVVYNNPSRLFEKPITDLDLAKTLMWPVLGVIITIIGFYIHKGKKKNIQNKNN